MMFRRTGILASPGCLLIPWSAINLSEKIGYSHSSHCKMAGSIPRWHRPLTLTSFQVYIGCIRSTLLDFTQWCEQIVCILHSKKVFISGSPRVTSTLFGPLTVFPAAGKEEVIRSNQLNTSGLCNGINTIVRKAV